MVTEQQVRRHLSASQNVNLTIALRDPMANVLQFSTLAGWLAGAFDWSRSPQGLVYWSRTCYQLNILDEKAKAERLALLFASKTIGDFSFHPCGVTS